MSRPLVLASTSPYRRKLLEQLDIEFGTCASEFDERAEDARLAELGIEGFALHLARGKAQSVRSRRPDSWILGADQIAVLPPDELMHKPGTPERAVEQLMRMSGHVLELVTGVVLLDAVTGATHEAVDRQRLTLRAFTRAEAESYVERHRPLDCAGSFRIEDAGITLFERIDSGDFTGIIGLPLLAVCRLLRGVGLLPA
ncbi:MAG TPA: Maf family protein [Nannocystis sp.]|jgi:septum formation protein